MTEDKKPDRKTSSVEHYCVKGRWVRGLRSDCERGEHRVRLQRGLPQDAD